MLFSSYQYSIMGTKIQKISMKKAKTAFFFLFCDIFAYFEILITEVSDKPHKKRLPIGSLSTF